MKRSFAPGCGLMLYKPHLAEKLHGFLESEFGPCPMFHTCCGDSFYGQVPKERVVAMMKRKASEMPREEIAVYCISCSKSMFVGSKRPRYMIDLVFGEDTVPMTTDPDEWHKELDEYIESHK